MQNYTSTAANCRRTIRFFPSKTHSEQWKFFDFIARKCKQKCKFLRSLALALQLTAEWEKLSSIKAIK
jgi:hypothetical protein